MNLNNYQQLALRTAGHMNTDQMLINSALGLPGEVAEIYDEIVSGKFDNTKIKKELGDLCWYIAIALHALSTQFSSVGCGKIHGKAITMNLVIATGKYSDYIKKVYFQGHKMDKEHCIELLSSCYLAIRTICKEWYYDFDQILQDNIDKLKRRYPDGFEVARSINRVEE
jgi:hypothetical protein